MAKELTPEEIAAKEEKKRLQDEKKAFKKEQAEAKKAAKKRAKELAKQEEELEEEQEGGGFVTFLATLFIIVLWLGVICVVIKLDIGGFGSSVLAPVLGDVPVLNKILPNSAVTETNDPESYGGYTSLQDAVNQIYALELQLEAAQTSNTAKDEQIASLQAEVSRLSEFESMQVEFQRIRNEFYEEVVYAENGPGAEEYIKYYQSMDPTTAEFLYKQVVGQLAEEAEWDEYVRGFSEMKPKEAAKTFEKMTDSEGLKLVAKILSSMNSDVRGKIMNELSEDYAARIARLMNPS